MFRKLALIWGSKSFYSGKGEDANGWALWQKVPVFNAVGELSYTISDDYRFPSPGPHGYQKIELYPLDFKELINS